MIKKITNFVAAGLLFSAVPVLAHHSFAAEFDEKKPVTLKGTLTKMLWVNPHGWIYLDVKGPNGKVENWAVEGGGGSGLLKRGLRKEDFKPGGTLIVKGYRAKNGTLTVSGTTITFEDGRKYSFGTDEEAPPK